MDEIDYQNYVKPLKEMVPFLFEFHCTILQVGTISLDKHTWKTHIIFFRLLKKSSKICKKVKINENLKTIIIRNVFFSKILAPMT